MLAKPAWLAKQCPKPVLRLTAWQREPFKPAQLPKPTNSSLPARQVAWQLCRYDTNCVHVHQRRCGKSTLACHLAIWLHDRGETVALLDADPQATASEWIRIAEPGITVRAAADMQAIQTVRDELIATHDFVVADAPGEEGEAANAVTLLSDFAVLPLQPTKPDIRALKDALKTIRLAHAVTQGKRPETVLVLNGVRKHSIRTSILRDQLRSYGHRVADCEVRRLDAIAESCDSAVTRENSPKAKEAAADIDSLFSELFSHLLTRKKVSNE